MITLRTDKLQIYSCHSVPNILSPVCYLIM